MHPTITAGTAEDRGPGLFNRTWLKPDGLPTGPVLTNLRVAGHGRRPGSVMVALAAALLFVLGAGLFGVSLAAQYAYIFRERHQHLASLTEAVALDVGMLIFSLLALGLARAGKSARVERLLIIACAAGSAVMNYAAADVISPRSVLAYTMPPVFLAVVVDRVVAVVRRHVLGEDERSPWAAFGRGALYLVRFMLAPPSTAKGLRRALLNCTPLPSVASGSTGHGVSASGGPGIAVSPARSKPAAASRRSPGRGRGRSGSKTSQFLQLVRDIHGPFAEMSLADVYRVSAELAPKAELDPGSARTALRRALLAARPGGEQQ